MYSTTWSGRTPSFFSTSAGPVQPPRPLASAIGSYSESFPSTSCAKSLSPVTTTTS